MNHKLILWAVRQFFTDSEIDVMQQSLHGYNRYDVPQAQSAFMKLERVKSA